MTANYSLVYSVKRIPLVGCQGSVLTAILTALIGTILEKKLRKAMPNALDLIMTPFVVMLATFLIVILGIGPVMHIVEPNTQLGFHRWMVWNS